MVLCQPKLGLCVIALIVTKRRGAGTWGGGIACLFWWSKLGLLALRCTILAFKQQYLDVLVIFCDKKTCYRGHTLWQGFGEETYTKD